VSSLAVLRDLVELDLDDSSNDVFSTEDVDRGMGRALVDYSHAAPLQAVGTIVLSADGREISLATLTGLTRVVKVWFPYDSSDPDHPPNWVRWSKWSDKLYIISGEEPADTEVVRVFYHKLHTIEDLAGESTTSIGVEDEEVVVLGAGAYCALQKARGSVAKAGVSTETPEHWLKWGMERMNAFSEALHLVRTRELRKIDKRVPVYQDAGWGRGGEYRGGI